MVDPKFPNFLLLPFDMNQGGQQQQGVVGLRVGQLASCKAGRNLGSSIFMDLNLPLLSVASSVCPIHAQEKQHHLALWFLLTRIIVFVTCTEQLLGLRGVDVEREHRGSFCHLVLP